MNTFKNLLIYSISLIALFSLTAISCEDLSEEVTIDVPTDVTKVIRLAREESGGFVVEQEVDLTSDEFTERREQMKDFTVESISFEVVDNLEGGSGVPNDLYLQFVAGNSQVSTGSNFLAGATLQAKLDGISPEMIDQIKRVVETYIIDKPNRPSMVITLGAEADAPMDYTITFVMEGTIEAGVE